MTLGTVPEWKGLMGFLFSITADVEGDRERFIVGARDGFAFMDRGTKKLEYVNRVWTGEDGAGKSERYVETGSLRTLVFMVDAQWNVGCVSTTAASTPKGGFGLGR